jgi:predicted lysophospholipase L1 biosynthesis ABC-type transport system permease subunit
MNDRSFFRLILSTRHAFVNRGKHGLEPPAFLAGYSASPHRRANTWRHLDRARRLQLPFPLMTSLIVSIVISLIFAVVAQVAGALRVSNVFATVAYDLFVLYG